jgi:preprotein translocase subunit SecG
MAQVLKNTTMENTTFIVASIFVLHMLWLLFMTNRITST